MTQDASGESVERPRVEIDSVERPYVKIEFVTALPDGRAVVPVEQEGKFAWLIAEGAMTEECRREMQAYLRHIVGTGMWTQNWPRARAC
ncbi:hypothetical protein [Streptomyces nigra]|uniref:hypothetical protein n=1 Tax=Streptomyces nigra TaxID=1827580 RepID=UPI00362C0456